MEVIILCLLVLGLTIPIAILRGYVIVCMWNWFVITQFPNVPHLSVVGAIGLGCLISLFSNYENKSSSSSGDRAAVLISELLKGTFMILGTWGIAWLVHLFM